MTSLRSFAPVSGACLVSSVLAAAPDAERAYIDAIMPLKQRYYLDYVAHRSLAQDLRILLRTAAVLLKGAP